MEDFIELGIEGVDKIVDKHFHKVPDKALRKETYDPRKLPGVRRMRRGSRDSPSPPPTPRTARAEPDPNLAYDDPYTEAPGGFITMQDNEIPRNGSPMYSNQPPHMRPQYMPGYSPPPYGANQAGRAGPFPPPPQPPAGGFQHPFDQERGNYQSWGGSQYRTYSPPRDDGRGYESDDEEYNSGSRRRPKMDRRRSSSYHGPRDGGSLAVARRGKDDSRSGGGRVMDSARDKAHRYGVKDEIRDIFTTSRAGLASGAVGAVVGGWAAHQAHIAQTGKKGKEKGNAALTLLGAATGALLADAIAHKIEVSREDSDKEEKKRDDPSEDRDTSPVPRQSRRRRDSFDSRSPSLPRRSSSRKSRRSRRRRNSYDDGYDSR